MILVRGRRGTMTVKNFFRPSRRWSTWRKMRGTGAAIPDAIQGGPGLPRERIDGTDGEVYSYIAVRQVAEIADDAGELRRRFGGDAGTRGKDSLRFESEEVSPLERQKPNDASGLCTILQRIERRLRLRGDGRYEFRIRRHE